MSNAEEAALKAYPKETRDVSGFVVDIGHPQYMRDLYVEGYHQAEKDNELTWEDIKTIDKLLNQCVDYSNPYQEVLKRFNKERKKNDIRRH